MSDINPTSLRRELLIKQGIELQLDKLVGLATQTVLKLPGDTKMEESQLRNLLNASIESGSVEVVANFVRYQIARKKDDWHTDPNGFGHTVINEIYDSLSEIATAVVQAAQDLVRAAAADEIQRLQETEDDQRLVIEKRRDADIVAFQKANKRIHIRLMHLYLGQLNRAFYFYKKSLEWQKPNRDAALQSLEKAIKLSKERSNA